MSEKKLKEKILNHIFKNGKKKTSEKILVKSFKSIQKIQKKSHIEITKLAIINSTPTFRIIKLKNNKRKKKKSAKEIPTFLSAYIYRTSWALKYLTKTLSSKISNKYHVQLKQEILLNTENQGNAAKLKNELHNQTLKNKKYLKYYRW